MAALSTIAAITAIAASVFSTASTLSQKGPVAPPPPKPPTAPDPNAEAASIEAALTRQKATALMPGTPAGRAGTLLTGPAGLDTAAQTDRKTLLGM